MADERHRQAAKLAKDDGPDLITQITEHKDKITKLEAENRDIDRRRPAIKKKYDEADGALQGYAPIRINTEKRASLERELKSLQDDYASFKASKNEFIITYLTLLNFYPRAKATLALIQEKQDKGALPPNVDKEQIQRLLDTHAKTCPICAGELDAKAIAHLK
jgi:ribosomal protein L14E/L6E/L27E